MKSKWSYKTPIKGDIIRVDMGNMHHYGIYVGNDEVIEFGEPFTLNNAKPSKDVYVIKCNIKDFLRGKEVEVREYNLKEKIIKNSNNKVVDIAYSQLGNCGYDIISNNCEHFVNFCVFNKKYSEEIQNIKKDIANKL